MLADDIISNGQRGYKTYILSENRAQLERLENIFYQSGRKEAQINPLPITLHEGFVDHDLKLVSIPTIRFSTATSAIGSTARSSATSR